ncbi:unnamed protein product [Cochlearia groenlandica]
MTTTASTASGSGAKMSMFGAKSGFVIPKNKLSGSLIPTFQRMGSSDSEVTKKRKTKWGCDLTQDASVKKARVLAYQKRLDQIMQQLESGTLEAETNRDIAESLELERRETIGEILVLNPRYKAPSDYKPLLKEAKLPINANEHSDLSFLSLLFSSQGDTQKRLEKETGAKVQVFGTKTGGEKVELSSSDENEIKKSWQELYFQISSETYEKVDAAIAVIKLLISSVSGNTGAGAPPSSKSEDVSTISGNNNATSTDPSSEQLTVSSVQPPPGQPQLQVSPFPFSSNQVPMYQPPNPSVPALGNPIQDQEQPNYSTTPNPLFSQQPLPIPHNTSLPPGSQGPRPPDLFSFNLSGTPRAYATAPPQGSLPQTGFPTLPPYSGSQVQPLGPRSTMRPSTLFTFHPVPNRVLRPAPLQDIVPSNMAQPLRPLAPNFSTHTVSHQPGSELPSIPFQTSINIKRLLEYASAGASLHPMSMSPNIAGRPADRGPTFPSMNPPANTAPRPFHGDFGFLPQSHISPRPISLSAHLPHLAFQAPSVTPVSQHFGQSFGRSQLFGRQMDPPLRDLSPLFHGNIRSSDLQNFGPPLPRMMPRGDFPGAQIPHLSAQFPPRPAFHRDNLNPNGPPQIRLRFNGGVHQVYDPFSPSDA